MTCEAVQYLPGNRAAIHKLIEDSRYKEVTEGSDMGAANMYIRWQGYGYGYSVVLRYTDWLVKCNGVFSCMEDEQFRRAYQVEQVPTVVIQN